MLGLYFRYKVVDEQECNLETRVIRGCKPDDTQVMRFVRHPPGPLRDKNVKDIEEMHAYIRSSYQEHRHDADCSLPGAKLRPVFKILTAAPLSASLANVHPFDGLIKDGLNVTYVDYACMAAVDWALAKVIKARAANGVVDADYSSELIDFFTLREAATLRGRCYLDPGEIPGGCPGEKDTKEGDAKGSDMGWNQCDFVEYINAV